MKDRTKEIIRDGFGGLVRNATALRGAKNGPLWLTLVMFFLSILLPVIPLFVTTNNVSGSSFIKSNTYNLERYVTKAALDLQKSKYEFNIGEDHLLSVSQNGVAFTEENYNAYDNHKKDDERSILPFYTYTNANTHEYNFIVFVSNINNKSPKVETTNSKGKTKLINAKTAYLTRISQFVYEVGTTDKFDLADETTKTTISSARKEGSRSFYYPSYMVLFQDSFNLVVCYGEKAVTGTTNGAADYKKVKATENCLATLLTVKDADGNDVVATDEKVINGTATEEEIDQDIANKMASPDYYNGVLKNFKKFLNRSYLASKAKTTLITCLFSLAIFAGMSLIMTFLMWIMTRGKNNPNNYFSLWLCFKLEARLALAPGLITLIVGFLLASYAQMIFILTLGMRVMWISMKELRPVQQ